jgi:16S rRNA (guanine527-N7)-methyltransferase
MNDKNRSWPEGLNEYLDLLERWNKRINLVGTQDREELRTQHAQDSLAVLAHIPETARRLVDVGSGAGFPGAVIAIARPDIEVTALEPIHKKHAFLCTVKRELGLNNLRPFAQRMDVHRGQAGFAPYDVAISRATFALPEWLSKARTLVGEGGVILGMEGRERHELPERAHRHEYSLKGRTRAIVVMVTVSETTCAET